MRYVKKMAMTKVKYNEHKGDLNNLGPYPCFVLWKAAYIRMDKEIEHHNTKIDDNGYVPPRDPSRFGLIVSFKQWLAQLCGTLNIP